MAGWVLRSSLRCARKSDFGRFCRRADRDAWFGQEYLHPTAWVGQQAVDWLNSKAKAEEPWFLKVSFHRPHSPYDPPARVLNATKIEDLPPVILAKE